MKTAILSLLTILSYTVVPGQYLRYTVANPYLGVSGYSTKQKDAFSFISNQAALAAMETMAVGVYGERRFMLAENSSYSAVAVLPIKPGNIGLQINYAGFSDFNENKIGLAYAKTLGKTVAVGIQFNRISYQMKHYGSLSVINFEGGLLMQVSPKVNVGVYTFNPVGGRMGKKGEEKVAGVYKLGLGFDASDEFFTGMEIVKEEGRPVNVCGGMQYRFMNQFFARAGFRSDNASFFGGAGMVIADIRIDVATSYHQQLGFSPSIMLVWALKEKGNE